MVFAVFSCSIFFFLSCCCSRVVTDAIPMTSSFPSSAQGQLSNGCGSEVPQKPSVL